MHLARSERKESLDLDGMEPGSGQLDFFRTSDEMTDGLAQVCGVFTITSLYRAALEHIRPATKRDTFLHEVSTANLLPGRFDEVLQDGRVPDGATDLLDQGAPPAAAVERPEGNELDEAGPSDRVPRKRLGVKAKTVKTEGLVNPDEGSVRDSSRERPRVMDTNSCNDHTNTRIWPQEMFIKRSWLLDSPFLCVRTMCFMQTWMPLRLCAQSCKGKQLKLHTPK